MHSIAFFLNVTCSKWGIFSLCNSRSNPSCRLARQLPKLPTKFASFSRHIYFIYDVQSLALGLTLSLILRLHFLRFLAVLVIKHHLLRNQTVTDHIFSIVELILDQIWRSFHIPTTKNPFLLLPFVPQLLPIMHF